MTYVYPKLPAAYTTPLFRIGGNGLANCLLVYAKAIITAKKNNARMIAPTWLNLTIGPHLRHETDKRHYIGLFNHIDEISGIKKWLILTFSRLFGSRVIYEKGIYDYFTPLIAHQELVSDYIICRIKTKNLISVNQFDFKDTIAVHVRLGDYLESWRVPMEWYKEKIKKYGDNKRILVFSDGKDSELQELLCLPNAERVFFGNAIADIVAMSKCDFLIGSDSSFSAWAAYLGQTPCCFYKLRFGVVLKDSTQQIIENS